LSLLQIRIVILLTCHWTPSATEDMTVKCPGIKQVTTVWCMLNRWLFLPTLDVRETAHNWLTGWLLMARTSLTGLDSWD